MKVMALLHEAVFMKAGSYVINPNSPASTLMGRRSMARMAVSPSVAGGMMGTEYVDPVRVSLISSAPSPAPVTFDSVLLISLSIKNPTPKNQLGADMYLEATNCACARDDVVLSRRRLSRT